MFGPEGHILSKGQGIQESIDVRAGNRLVVLNELSQIIMDKHNNPDKPLDICIANRYNSSSSPLKHLATENFIRGKKSETFLKAFEGFYAERFKGKNELKIDNVILEVENFSWSNLWGKSLILNTAQFKKDEVQKFNQKAYVFREGEITQPVFGVSEYRLGWNEAEKTAISKYEELTSKEYVKGIRELEEKQSRFYTQRIEYNRTRRFDAAGELANRINEIQEKLDQYYSDLYEWEELKIAIADYRQNGVMFDNEKWNVLLKEIPEKNGLRTIAPEFNETKHPLIQEFNDNWGKQIDCYIKTTGFKGPDRMEEKIGQTAYDNDASSLGDGLRSTFAYSKSVQMEVYIRQRMQIMNEDGIKYTFEPPEITQSGWYSCKFNTAIPIEFEGNKYYRLSESKVTIGKQLEVKPEADVIYNVCRAMAPEVKKDEREYLDISDNPTATQEEKSKIAKALSNIRRNIEKLFKNGEFKKLLKNSEKDHGIKIEEPEALRELFINQQVFNKFHDTIQPMERRLFYESLADCDESVRKEFYLLFRDNNDKGKKGFSAEDLKRLSDLALWPGELEKFESEYQSKKQQAKVLQRK